MKKEITFVTTNAGKFEEVKHWIEEFDVDITLTQTALDIPEIQSLDVHEIATRKAQQAWAELKKPLLIDDGGIFLSRYNQFPGALSKYVYEGIGLDGFWLLAKDDPLAYFMTSIVYVSGNDSLKIFDGVCQGTIIEPAHWQEAHIQLPFTKIFVPQGTDKTMAQLRHTPEEKKYHHRYKAIEEFVMWFKGN